MSGFLLLAASEETHQNLSIFDPVSPPGESIRTLTVLVFAIIGAIFFIVEGILLYSVFRFRHRGEPTTTEPPQVYGSKPIEIAWTAAPTLVVFILVLVITRTLWEVNVDAGEPKEGDNTLFVTVVGKQWWWEYHYTHYNGKPIRAVDSAGNETDRRVITANELHIPASDNKVSRRVYLTLKSADVCHSFWVPRLSGKMDLIPGRTNSLWFQTKEPGLYVGQCAEYCGFQHANMLLRVRVRQQSDFQDWLDNQRKPANDKPLADDRKEHARQAGKAILLKQSCVNCHRIRGVTDMIDKDQAYPDLTHVMSRETLASGMIPNDKEGENLRKWIRNPQKVKEKCIMPAFGLKDSDVDLIVDYLKTLR
jgi:cytochrome c oxidase subunit 2